MLRISDQRRLLERGADLERIEALLAAVEEGRGRGLIVEGPTGIGSTLLGAATELVRRAERRGKPLEVAP